MESSATSKAKVDGNAHFDAITPNKVRKSATLIPLLLRIDAAIVPNDFAPRCFSYSSVTDSGIKPLTFLEFSIFC